MTPIISVVVPAYNEEKYLPACLEALCSQDFPLAFEIIVVNNNSTDKTEKVAQGFPHVRVVLEKQKGYPFALKRGYQDTKAEIIAICDADTVTPSDWLSRIYSIFQKDEMIVGVSGGFDYETSNFVRDFIKNLSIFIFKIFNTASGFNMAFKKEALERVGGIMTNVDLGADNYIFSRLKTVGKCYYFPNLKVITSSRRFQKLDLKYLFLTTLTYFKLVFFKKAGNIGFSDIR